MEQIDIVIPFVDGNDPFWDADFKKYETEFNPSAKTDGNKKIRFDGNDILKYVFRSIDIYAPWVHKIHLLLYSKTQVPKWLNKSHHKVKIVYHSQFIPIHNLPLFNSSCIEMYLWNIPELSEHFLYFNDDIIFNSFTCPEDFFSSDGKMKKTYQKTIYKKSDVINADYFNTFLNSAKLAAKGTNIVPYGYEYVLTNNHGVVPYSVTTMKEAFTENSKTIENSMSKFRKRYNLNQNFFNLYDIFHGYTNNQNISFQYFQLKAENIEVIKQKLNDNNIKTICLNDTIATRDKDKIDVKKLLEIKFPVKSSYEK